MSEYGNYYSIIEKALDEAPDELMGIAPSAVMGTVTMIKSGIDLFKHHQPLKILHGLVSTSATTTKEQAESLVGSLNKIPAVTARGNDLAAAAQSPTAGNASLTKCLNDSIRESGNAVLGLGIALSFVTLLHEAGRLANIFGDIQNAKRFIKNGFDERRASIQKKLDGLPGKLANFAEGLEETKLETLNDRQRLRFHLRKCRERDSLRTSLDKISQEIGDLEISVKGKITKLSSYRSTSVPAAVGEVLQGATLGANLTIFGGAANPVMAAVTGVMILAHFIGAGAELYVRCKTDEIISQLQKQLLQVEELKEALARIQDDLSEMFLNLMDERQEITVNA